MSDLTHLLGKYVQLRTAQAHPHAEGEVVGVYTEPTVIVETDRGQVTWLARLVHEADRPTPADRCRTEGHDITVSVVSNAAGQVAHQSVHCTRCGLPFVPQETP